MTERQPIVVGSVPFTISNLQGATEQVISNATSDEPTSVRLANAYCVALAEDDDDYQRLLATDGINYPDGTPVAWVMRRQHQGTPRPQQVRGPSLFENVLDQGRDSHLRHFFLGTSDRTLAALRAQIELRFPGTTVSGTFSPPFAPLDDEFYRECVSAITETETDIVWVALGTPKQDFAAYEITKLTGITTVAVGAAFEFLAGTVKQAPSWSHGTGLEWLFRLATEPRRLWRRYLIGNTRFLRAVLAQTLKRNLEFKNR